MFSVLKIFLVSVFEALLVPPWNEWSVFDRQKPTKLAVETR